MKVSLSEIILALIFLGIGLMITPFAINAHMLTAKNFDENPEKYWRYYLMSLSFLAMPFLFIGISAFCILRYNQIRQIIPIYDSNGIIINGVEE